MTEDRVIDKVMKLLAKSETTTPEEAEALVAKATDLMMRHEISEAMLAHAQGRQIDEITTKKITFRKTYSQAQLELFFTVGSASGFRNLYANIGSGVRVGTWVGFKHDLEQAELLLTSLLIQQQRACAAFVKEQPPADWMSAFDKFAYKRSHMLGFASGVGEIIRKQRRDTAAAVQKEHDDAHRTGIASTAVALVLRTKEEQVNDWYDTRYGKLKAGRGGPQAGNGYAHSAGHDAGRRADLGSNRIGARKAIGR